MSSLREREGGRPRGREGGALGNDPALMVHEKTQNFEFFLKYQALHT